MTPIEVQRTEEPQSVRIELTGELDIATVDDVERQIGGAGGDLPEVLVVDLSGLSFMDSTGLRMILSTDARQRAGGKRMVLVPGPESVHRVFRLALLEDRLEFQPPPVGEWEG
jgi:anti-sigma B factor antagonist